MNPHVPASRNLPDYRAETFGAWFPVAIVVCAVLPLGSARSPLMLNALIVMVTCGFIVKVTIGTLRDGFKTTAAALVDTTPIGALAALPILAVSQLALHWTIGFGNAAPYETLASSFFLISLALFYLLVRSVASTQRGVRILLVSLVVIGTFEAGYAILNLLSGNEYVLVYKRWIHYNSATGTFYSRNQFAYLMELLIPISIAFVPIFAKYDVGKDSAGSETKARTMIAGIAVVTMALGLLFSRSRMGIVSFAVSTFILFAADRLLSKQGRKPPDSRKWPAGIILIAITVLGFGTVIGLEPVLERFFNIDQDLAQGRGPLWNATIAMGLERPIFGHGWGSFETMIPAYRPRPTGLYYDHAHNEYLEVFAETGIIGLAVVSWLVGRFCLRVIASLRAHSTPTQHGLTCALAISITSVLFHSAADFGLRIPGIAFTFVLTVALFVRVTERPELIDGVVTSPRRQQRASR